MFPHEVDEYQLKQKEDVCNQAADCCTQAAAPVGIGAEIYNTDFPFTSHIVRRLEEKRHILLTKLQRVEEALATVHNNKNVQDMLRVQTIANEEL